MAALWGPETKRILHRLLGKDDPVVLEVGCNDGTDTLEFLAEFPGIRLFCFEPDPRSVAVFERNVVDSRCFLIKTAIGDQDGSTTLHMSGGWPSREDGTAKLDRDWDRSSSIRVPTGHLLRFPDILFENTQEVRISKLDSWLETQAPELELIDLVWADVQGAEADLFRGGSRTFEKTRYVYTEFYDTPLYEGQPDLDQILALLRGFKLVARVGNNALLKNARLGCATAGPGHPIGASPGDTRPDTSGDRAVLLLDHVARPRGYSCTRELKAAEVYEISKGGQRFALKKTTPAGLAVLRDTVPRWSLARPCIAPEFVEGGETDGIGCWTIYRWCEGRDFTERWSELDAPTAGGRALDVRSVPAVLDLLERLAAMSPPEEVVPPEVRLTPASLRARIEHCLALVRPRGWIGGDEERRLAEIVEPMLTTIGDGQCTITNGDFQFRNFIERADGTLLLLDWDHARYTSYEIEHCVSYQWLLMWNNPDWQREFLASARRRFAIQAKRFRSAFVRNALFRLVAWRRDSALSKIARNTLAMALSDTRFDQQLWQA